MGLASEMKNLSEELLASFTQRIKDNEELVNDVQKTLDGFRKDHQEMAVVLNANAAALGQGLANGEKDRINTYNDLMANIHSTIASIQTEVVGIQTSTFNMINLFSVERSEMAGDLNKFFAEDRAGRMEGEKTRLAEFDEMMKNINDDIKSNNDEVLSIFKNTNEMLADFQKDHLEMAAELKADLGKNLADRVEYTRTLLHSFQKRLSEISMENQKMASNLRKGLATGETVRLKDFNTIMKGIHTDIKGIRKEVMDIQKATNGMITDLTRDRGLASADWAKMQEAMAQIRKTGIAPAKPAAKKAEKKEVKPEPVAAEVRATPAEVKPVGETLTATPATLEEKVLNYISMHPKGVKIAEMEVPLGETRMKLGYVAKNLLDEGKVQKVENVYFPLK